MVPTKEESHLSTEEAHRDTLLVRLLKTPPQPRPKRDRDKEPTDPTSEKPSIEGTPAPSA